LIGDGGGVDDEDVYTGNREEPVLTSLSDSYLELEIIFISVSGPSSYSTSYFFTDYFNY